MRFFLFVWLMEETDKDWIRGKRQKNQTRKDRNSIETKLQFCILLYIENSRLLWTDRWVKREASGVKVINE